MSTNISRDTRTRRTGLRKSPISVHSTYTVTLDTGGELPSVRRRMHSAVHCCNATFYSSMYEGRRLEKIGYFRRKSPFISETVLDRPMVTMER